MSELDGRVVEAVARALCDRYTLTICTMPEWDGLPERHRIIFLGDAIAAITAYQSATGDALTEALRERDELIDALHNPTPLPPCDRCTTAQAALTEAEHQRDEAEAAKVAAWESAEQWKKWGEEAGHRAERAEKVVAEAVKWLLGGEPQRACDLLVAALDTTAGPGGTQ